MTLLIAPIVEGETEVLCAGPLLHRVWHALPGQSERLLVLPAVRRNRGRLVHENGVELARQTEAAAISLASRARGDPDARLLILVLIDAEGDCAAALALAPRLLDVARAARSDLDIECVLPVRMFENWFVAAAASLRAAGVLPAGPPPPDDLERCRGVTWLEDQFKAGGLTYQKIVDGLRCTRAFDLATCRAASPSFDKLCRVLADRIAPAPPPNLDADASGS